MRLKSGGFRRLFRDCRGGATLEWASKLAAVLAVSGGIYVVGHAGGNRIAETGTDVSGMRAADDGDTSESLAGAGWGRADDEACRDVVVPVFGSIWASEWFKCAFQEFQDNNEFQYVGDTLGMTDEQLLELLSQITLQGTIDFVVNVTPKIIEATPGLLAQGWNWLTTNSIQHIAGTVFEAVIVQPITFAAGMVTGTYENGKEIVAAWNANDGRRAGRAAKSIATGAPEALSFLIFDANDYKDMAHLAYHGGGHILGKMLGKHAVAEVAEHSVRPALRLVAKDGVALSPVQPFGPNSVSDKVTSIAPYMARREREAAQEVMQLAVNDVARPGPSSRSRFEVVPRSNTPSPTAEAIPRNGDGVPMGMCFTTGTEVHTAHGLVTIETVALGERVLTTRGAVESPTEVDESWRRIELEMEDPRSADGMLHIAMLRPSAWMNAVRARVGAMIEIDLQEMQVRGFARVTWIGDAPPIEPGVGRVVLMTVQSQSSNVLALKFHGTDEVLAPTWGHRLFSLDRNDWIETGKLRVGERLHATNGNAVIASITQKSGTHTVYNFEVESEHEYLVGNLGIQSHNDHDCAQPPPPRQAGATHEAAARATMPSGTQQKLARTYDVHRYREEARLAPGTLSPRRRPSAPEVEEHIARTRSAIEAEAQQYRSSPSVSAAPGSSSIDPANFERSIAHLDDGAVRAGIDALDEGARTEFLRDYAKYAGLGPHDAFRAALPTEEVPRLRFLEAHWIEEQIQEANRFMAKAAVRGGGSVQTVAAIARSRAFLENRLLRESLVGMRGDKRTRFFAYYAMHAHEGPERALAFTLSQLRRLERVPFEETYKLGREIIATRAAIEVNVQQLLARRQNASRALFDDALRRLDDPHLRAVLEKMTARRAQFLERYVANAHMGGERALEHAVRTFDAPYRARFTKRLAERPLPTMWTNNNNARVVGFIASTRDGLPRAASASERARALTRHPLFLHSLQTIDEAKRPGFLATYTANAALGEDEALRRALGSLELSDELRFLRSTQPRRGRGLCFTADTEVHTPQGLVTIEKIELGDRVLTTQGAVHGDTAADASWRRIELEMEDPRSADGMLHIAMLRAPTWVEATRAHVGAMIDVDLQEMQVRGPARVTSIGDAPHIEPGIGRVVLMTVQSQSSNVLILKLRGTDETLEPTWGHRLYSLDRNEWIEAGELRAGERLRAVSGEAVVASITQKRGTHTVYNFEVEAEHEYLVGKVGVQSHNDHDCGVGAQAAPLGASLPERVAAAQVRLDQLATDMRARRLPTERGLEQVAVQRANADLVHDATLGAGLAALTGPDQERFLAAYIARAKRLASLTDAEKEHLVAGYGRATQDLMSAALEALPSDTSRGRFHTGYRVEADLHDARTKLATNKVNALIGRAMRPHPEAIDFLETPAFRAGLAPLGMARGHRPRFLATYVEHAHLGPDEALRQALESVPSSSRTRFASAYAAQLNDGDLPAPIAEWMTEPRGRRDNLGATTRQTSSEVRGLCFTAGTEVHTPSGSIAIENVALGDRVLTTRGAIASATAVDSSWHRIEVEMEDPRSADGMLHIAMLRPSAWVEAVRARVGAMIEIDLPEMQVRGHARVTSIGNAPHIEPGVGRVVLMTVQSQSSNVLVLKLRGTDETLEPTWGHRLFSLDRNDWIEAGELRIGERLRATNGDAIIVSIMHKPGTHTVYNFEVEAEHEYLVGKLGVQSHNDHDCGPTEVAPSAANSGSSASVVPPYMSFPTAQFDAVVRSGSPVRVARGLLDILDPFADEVTKVWTDDALRQLANALPTEHALLESWGRRFLTVKAWALDFVHEGMAQAPKVSRESVAARVALADIGPGDVFSLPKHTLGFFAERFGSPLLELIDVFDELGQVVRKSEDGTLFVAIGSADDPSSHGQIGTQSLIRFTPEMRREEVPENFAHEVAHYGSRDGFVFLPPSQCSSEEEFVQHNLRSSMRGEATAELFRLRASRAGRAHGLSLPDEELPATQAEIDAILAAYDAGNVPYAEERMLEVVSRVTPSWRDRYDGDLRRT